MKHFCENCKLSYDVDEVGNPITGESYTCDDCGGYVGPEVGPPSDAPDGES